MKTKVFFMYAACFCAGAFLFCQQHLSVPLTDPVYVIIENAQIRNLIRPLQLSKPYSRATVIEVLTELAASEVASIHERQLAEEWLTQQAATNTDTWYYTGKYRFDSSTTQPEKPLITTEIGGHWSSSLNTNFNSLGVSTEHWLGAYVRGDLSKYFSYNINLNLGAMYLSLDAHSPYTFSRNWDGAQLVFSKLNNYVNLLEKEPVAGYAMLPELSYSAFDNRLGVNFSRVRRDWGPGEGNLMLSGTAPPFMGIDMYLHPVDWFNVSFVGGILEYQNTKDLKDSAMNFQNAFTAASFDFFIGKWVYASVFSSAIWPKRFELTYLHPGMVPFFGQHIIGDFDNMQLGGTLGVNIPGYANLYYNLFLDEINLLEDQFFNKARNMYTYQVGAKIAVPKLPWTTVVAQYTKVEPYMYTHPKTKTPWYHNPMDTTYITHGEPLGYKLDPNSDELMIKAKSMPFWFLNAELSYRMIRHGVTRNGYTGENAGTGNYFDKPLNYTVPDSPIHFNNVKKDFLKDGIYEWYHAIGLSAELDLRSMQAKVPVKLGLGYTFVYKYFTNYAATGNYSKYETDAYKSKIDNIISIYLKIYQ